MDERPGVGLKCSGCGLPVMHKMCVAHGTPAYMNFDHPAWGNLAAIELLKENATLATWLLEIEKNRDQLAAYHALVHKHELTPNLPDCQCPVCMTHRKLIAAEQKLASAEHVIDEIYAELEKAEERSRLWFGTAKALREGLGLALACGLPPHDVSGQAMWQKAREAFDSVSNFIPVRDYPA